MIDLFSLWFGGFLVVMVLNCVAVKEAPTHLQPGPLVFISIAVLWPVAMGYIVYLLTRDR